jgi:urocanate hydratase
VDSLFLVFLSRLDWTLAASGPACVKLQIDEGMWNGFDFYDFYLDRINRIIRNFFACGEGPFGRRPHYPNDPVDPVRLFSLK